MKKWILLLSLLLANQINLPAWAQETALDSEATLPQDTISREKYDEFLKRQNRLHQRLINSLDEINLLRKKNVRYEEDIEGYRQKCLASVDKAEYDKLQQECLDNIQLLEGNLVSGTENLNVSKQELSDVQNELKALAKEHTQVSNDLAGADQRLEGEKVKLQKRLDATILHAEAEVKALKARLEANNQLMEEKEKTIVWLLEKEGVYKKDLTESEKEKKILKDQSVKAERVLSKFQKENERFKDEQKQLVMDLRQEADSRVEEKDRGLSGLKDDLNALKITLKDEQTVIKEREEEIKILQGEVSRTEKALSSSEDKANGLKTKLAEIEESLSGKDQEGQSLIDTVKTLEKSVKEKSHDIKRLTDDVVLLTSERDGLSERVMSIQTSEKDLNKEVKRLKKIQKENEKLADDLAVTQNNTIALKTELDDLVVRLADVNGSFDAKLTEMTEELQGQVSSLSTEVAEKEKALVQQKQDQSKMSKAEVEKLTTELNLAKTRAAELETQMAEEIAQSTAPLETRIAELTEKVENASSSAEEKVGQAKVPLLSKINMLEKRLLDRALEVEEKDSTIKQLNTDVVQVRQQLTAAEAQSSSSTENIARLEQQLLELRQRMDMEVKAGKDKSFAVQNVEKEKQKLMKEVALLQNDKAALEKELFKINDEMEEMDTFFKEQMVKIKTPLEKQIQQNEETLILAEEAIFREEEEMKLMQKDKEILNRELIKKDQEIMRLKKMLEESR